MKNHIIRCKKCVLSNAFPAIRFDENGLCNYCVNEEFYAADEDLISSTKEKIISLFQKYKGRSEYDAVMCYSGGKDSTYALLQSVKEYKLRVLTFTLDNGFISPVAFVNIRTIVDRLGVDNMMYRPSMKFFNELVKISAFKEIYHPKTMKRISSVCNSCISLVNNTALKIAVEKNIPLIIAGFTLGQIPSKAIIYKNHYKFLKESRELYNQKLRRYMGNMIDKYFYIPDATIDKINQYPYTINILCIEEIAENKIYNEISKYGWKKPKDVDGCSSNCTLNTFNNYVHQLMYQYHPYEYELSQLVRAGQLSRRQAINKMTEVSCEQLETVFKKLGINNDEIKKRLGQN